MAKQGTRRTIAVLGFMVVGGAFMPVVTAQAQGTPGTPIVRDAERGTVNYGEDASQGGMTDTNMRTGTYWSEGGPELVHGGNQTGMPDMPDRRSGVVCGNVAENSTMIHC